MAYNGKTNWQLNEIVKPEDMNRIEQGVIDAHENLLTHKTDTNSHTDIRNKFNEFVKGVTGSNATLTITKGNGTTSTVTVNNVANATNATNATNANKLSYESGSNYLEIDTTKDSWDVLGSNPGSWLKSIRTGVTAPPYSIGNYSAATAFGGADTKGIITHAYSEPSVKFAGGNGSTAGWKFSIYGGYNNETYDLNNFPTKTGGGASGTWGINITGNAASATTANTATILSGFTYLDTGDWGHSTGTYITGFREQGGGSIQWRAKDGMLYERIDGTFWQREGTYEVIDTSTVNNYAPTKTGGGASGTWGINITGNAASATNAVNDGNGANIANTYLKRSGGGMSGALNFANSTWNLVGDDSYMGDHDIGGTFCVKGANGETGIALVNNENENDYARISYGGGNINFNRKITANLAGTADNATQWNGLVNDIMTENNIDTWIPVLKDNKLQHTTKANMSVGRANTAGTADIAGKVYGIYTYNGGRQGPAYFGRNSAGFLMSNAVVNSDANFKNWLYMDNYEADDVGGTTAFGVSRVEPRAFLMQSDANRSSWNNSAELLSTYNYNTYAPKKDGTGASGTWGINISGNANNATNDSAGQQINTTYIKGLSISGNTITYTKGNGGTGSITVPTGAGAKGYVTESVVNSDGSWYRKWSDGWLEQGGKTSSKRATITFPKAFSTAPSTVVGIGLATRPEGCSGSQNEFCIYNITATSFYGTSYDQNNGYNGFTWFACGK